MLIDRETLNALPYLEAFVHEILRLHPPFGVQVRQAQRDTVVPLGTAVKGRDGRMMSELHVNKGTTILICERSAPRRSAPCIARSHPATRGVNLSRAIWGPDAREFKPERHIDSKPEQAVAGVWGNIMTFAAGPRNCM